MSHFCQLREEVKIGWGSDMNIEPKVHKSDINWKGISSLTNYSPLHGG
jgi:hypothetical protein